MNVQQRPVLLTSALILSTIGSSLLSLTYLLTALFYRQTLPYIEQFTNAETTGLISRFYAFSLGACGVVSLAGIMLMWKFRKSGFYLYLGAQVAWWVLPLLVIGRHAFSSTATIFTLLFLAIYLAFLRQLK